MDEMSAKLGSDALLSVLVVEDDRVVAEAIRHIVRAESMQVTLCGTAKEARALFAKQKPDIVILDIQLPDELSYDFAKEIRRDSNALILFLSSRDSVSDKLFGLELGADDYLTKPFNQRELAIRLNNMGRRVLEQRTASNSTNEAEHSIEFANWSFSPELRQLTEKGEMPISLTPLETKVLEVFASNPEKIYTRKDLILLSHGEGKTATARTIDILIMRLRRKLGETPAEPHHIITVSGQGYFFQCP